MAEKEGDTRDLQSARPGERRVAAGGPTGASGERRARILVIDDEPLLGQTLRLAFEDTHDVVVATSGRSGLEVLERDVDFDLVLCDLAMPDVNGMLVYQRAVALDARLARHFVLMTGGAFTPAAREFLAKHPGPRLEKPFEMAEVESLLGELRSEG